MYESNRLAMDISISENHLKYKKIEEKVEADSHNSMASREHVVADSKITYSPIIQKVI